MSTTTATPAVHDRIIGGSIGTIRIEWLSERGDAYLRSSLGGGWSVPVEYLILVRPGTRGGDTAEWAIDSAWTDVNE